MKIRLKINELESGEIIEINNDTSWFLRWRLTDLYIDWQGKKTTQMTNLRIISVNITTNVAGMKKLWKHNMKNYMKEN